MATAAQRLKKSLEDADEFIREAAEDLQEKIDKIDKQLRPYERLKERQNKLRSAQRALLGGQTTTGEAGDRLTSAEVRKYLTENPGSKPGKIAEHFGVKQPTVSSHLYRKKDEMFITKNGRWWARDPKNGLNTVDDIEEDE